MRMLTVWDLPFFLLLAPVALNSEAMAVTKRLKPPVALIAPAQIPKPAPVKPVVIPVQTAGISAYPITAGSSARPFMMLWGRHSPKFVRAGYFRYALIETDGHRAVLYLRSEKEANTAWRPIWKSKPEVHQPPSLVLDQQGRLHVLYVDVPGQLTHVIFNDARLGRPSLAGTPSTRRSWGLSNAYMGAAYNRKTASLFVCATNFSSSIQKCASFRNDSWGPARNLLSSPNQLFLYPVIEPSERGAWIATSAYPRGAATGIRTSNVVMPIDGTGAKDAARQPVTYGSTAIDRTYFENDAALDSKGNIVVLATPVAAKPNQLVNDTVSLHSNANHFGLPTPIDGVRGSAFSLISDQIAMYFVGAGILGISKDDGRAWSLRQYELPGYPPARYSYAVAQTLQARSGTAWPQTGISFLQELIDRSTNQKLVVEVNLDPSQPVALAASTPPVTPKVDHQSTQQLLKSASRRNH